LASGAADRLDRLELPGTSFVVTVNGAAVYAGEFMALWFPRSSDQVVILWPSVEGETTLRIQLGYPDADFFAGVDPRSDDRILEALEEAGKLR